MKSGGIGILMHRTGEHCPASVPFMWETGEPLADCEDCAGSLMVVDSDGSMTGFRGSLVPCCCSNSDQGDSRGCACFLAGWPLDGGFTGWVADLDGTDSSPVYRPCWVHTPSRANATVLAVAA
ncbi:hypothetical protein [Streptomyces erythrochromogenes]|uniref:hypothetical protein n=1 Tax=Streptomyces erythrochromogenes TaxID=285574 RepID=UPI0038060A96